MMMSVMMLVVGGAKPARLSGRANGLLDAGCIPASLAGIVLVPARDPGLANGDGVSILLRSLCTFA